MGGGTPSMLSPKQLERLFKGIGEHIPLSQLKELTFEANPATFTQKKVSLFKELGITRVSLGVQSFSNRILKTLGREHTREQAIESVKLLQQVGIPEVNIDLMFAVPGQPLEEWIDTLETAVFLKPDHISCYNLTYEEDGFIHYETSNYSQPGKQSQHNQSYWIGNDYVGIGPSAVGTINNQRYKNISDTASYIKRVEHIQHAQQDIENLTKEDYRIERIALLLRTDKGLPKQWTTASPEEQLTMLLDEDLAEWKDDHLRLINNGPMFVDSIAERLI